MSCRSTLCRDAGEIRYPGSGLCGRGTYTDSVTLDETLSNPDNHNGLLTIRY